VRVERYGLVPDSEGPGRHRGGFGIAREITFLGDRAECVIGSDRTRVAPWGLDGGLPAAGSSFVLERGRIRRELPSKTRLELRHGDRLLIETSGGGGWGSPRERDRELVLRDVREGLVSADRADSVYGVSAAQSGDPEVAGRP
jgi:N-methylhydantoinase B